MKIQLLFVLLLTQTIIISQEIWRPMETDDFNQASYQSVYKTKMVARNNYVYQISLEIVQFASKEKLVVNRFDGTKWEQLGYGFYSTTTAETSAFDIAVDSNNIPYIFFFGGLVKKYQNNNWVNVGSNVATTGTTSSHRIAMASDNTPYIFYKGTGDTSAASGVVKKFNGTSWVTVGPSVATNVYNNTTALALDANNVPYVSYVPSATGNTMNIVIKKFDGLSWQEVGTTNFVTQYISYFQTLVPIAFDSQNNPYIVYKDATSYSLLVRKFNGSTWELLGSGGISFAGSDGAIAINNDIPYVAFLDPQTVIGKGSLKKYENGNWVTVGPEMFTEGQANSISIAFQDNVPYYSCRDDGNAAFATVRKLNGNTWQILGQESFAAQPNSVTDWLGVDLALNSQNVAYVAYKDRDYDDKLSVKKFNGTSWEYVGSPGFSPAGIDYDAEIEIDSNGIPYVAYLTYVAVDSSFRISVAKFNGSAWELVGLANFSGRTYTEFDFKINSANVPYVAYRGGNSLADNPRCSVMKFNGTAWVNEGNPYFTPAKADQISMAFDQNDIPYIVFEDYGASNRFTVEKFAGSWQIVGGAGFTFEGGLSPIIAFDNNNIPYIAFVSDFNFKPTVEKFTGTWQIIAEGTFTAGICSRLDFAIDNNNDLYVVYNDVIDDYRKMISVKKFANNAWQNVGPVAFSAGEATREKISIGTNNVPCIVYQSMSGLFGKYYGTADALTVNDNADADYSAIIVSPNPVKNTFSISSLYAVDEITLYDMTGKNIYHQNGNNTTINIESLKTGLYLVRIKTSKGLFTCKISKE
ncbi:T9SS type A sorting domain-containing protein [Flavobacterium sp.]|uniref:T9SS type A sorting domain-containing protein n=1 Tax=Flavobacterium sp. TaxID=239 RepID=UPI00286A7A92|nr:T9SS type A sorting domain-containing protein [Flavobacterium sp.]